MRYSIYRERISSPKTKDKNMNWKTKIEVEEKAKKFLALKGGEKWTQTMHGEFVCAMVALLAKEVGVEEGKVKDLYQALVATKNANTNGLLGNASQFGQMLHKQGQGKAPAPATEMVDLENL